jgi:3-oxoacyl-[acyl-carrier protein] reductase
MPNSDASVKVLVITGTSKGLGLELVKHYSSVEATTVVGISRSESNFESESYFHYQSDITDPEATKKLFNKIYKQFGRIDGLINNAGASEAALVSISSIDHLSVPIQVNLLGAISCCREVSRYMMKKKYGRIVNISSVQIDALLEGTAPYVASKLGLEGFSQVFARECYGQGITLNNVRMSAVRGVGMAERLAEKAKEKLLGRTNTKVEIDLADVIFGLDFFLDPAAKKMTGQTLSIG